MCMRYDAGLQIHISSSKGEPVALAVPVNQEQMIKLGLLLAEVNEMQTIRG